MRRRFLNRVAVLAAVTLGSAALAQGVPHTLSFTGNLTNGGTPMTGAHTLDFKLFDQANTQVWNESHPAVQVSNGMVYVTLGTVAPLTPVILNGAPLTLEVSVDTVPLSPRAAIQSVPYALRAEVANSAETLGTMLPSDVQRRVTGTCTGANAVQSIDAAGAVTCVSTAGSAGDITSVNTLAGSGLTGGAATGDVNVSLVTCAAGQVLKAGTTAGTWACGNDLDTNTTYTAAANGGVSVAGTSIGLITTCAAGQVLKAGATPGTWACANDLDTNSGGTITGITTSPTSGLTGGCVSGNCTLAVDPTPFNAVPVSVFDTSGTATVLSTAAFTTLHSVSVNVPAPGYLVVMYDGMHYPQNLSASNPVACTSYGFTTSTTANPTTTIVACDTFGGSATSYSRVATSGVFPVNAGVNTIYMRARINIATNSTNAYNHNLTAFFIPG